MAPPMNTRRHHWRWIVAGTTLTLAAGAVIAVVLPASAATAATGPITGLAGKCVDVAGASSANGTAIQLYTCNGTGAQQWSVGADGTVQALGKCLDVAAAGTADGTRVQLYDCNGTGAQQWTYSSGHDLVNPNADKCLDVTGNTATDSTPLQIWTCTGGSNQKWTIPSGGGDSSPTATAAPTATGTAPPANLGSMVSAPYYYRGWGNPADPTTVMSASGIKWFTMAFMLAANNSCDPQWDGYRALTGGDDQSTIAKIRAAGGDIMPSFGGASGPWLESTCTSASSLAAAYQKVISAYGLKAMDVDIEGSQTYDNATVQQRTIDALKIIKANNPGIVVYVTFPSNQGGPDNSMISRAAASGLAVDGWSIMTFDWGGAGQNMATLTAQAVDGLKSTIKNSYGYTDDQAYRHAGISSMNGITDNNETVTVANFQTIEAYAALHHLARLTFWSNNRDRPCSGGYPNDDTCSGVAQQAWDFTKINAQYTG